MLRTEWQRRSGSAGDQIANFDNARPIGYLPGAKPQRDFDRLVEIPFGEKAMVGVPNAGGALDGAGPTNVGDKRLRQQAGLCREPLPKDCSNQPFNLRPTLIAERNNSE